MSFYFEMLIYINISCDIRGYFNVFVLRKQPVYFVIINSLVVIEKPALFLILKFLACFLKNQVSLL
jgi:hypothetical protein